MATLLLTHKQSRSTASSRKAAAAIVNCVIHKQTIPNFGAYRQKRFLDVLCLAGSCIFGGIAFADEDLDGSCSMYPVAANTITGLRAFFRLHGLNISNDKAFVRFAASRLIMVHTFPS